MMKSKFKNGLLAIAFIIIWASLLFSCAQQKTSISGGDKDTTAPVMSRSTPEISSGNFDGQKVKIKFDEYFTLDKIEQTFLMTPPHDSLKPKIKVKGKKIVVKFKEPLKSDTTYTLQFFDAIQDFNEGNKIPNYNFVFSTGEVIDTFAVSGHVYDAQTLEKEKGMLVCLYGEGAGLQDSAFVQNKPDYVSRTDTSGYFHIPNIKKGRYRIFALSDINETQRFDLENEKVAFLKTYIEPRAERMLRIDSLPAGTILHRGEKGHRYLDTLASDTVIVQDINYTTPNNINLYTFEEIHLTQYISERSRDIRERVNLVFNKSVENDTVLITYVDDTLRSPAMVYDFNYGRDSLTVWLKDTADINNDTLQLRVTFATLDSLKNPTTETDTISVKFARKKATAKKDDKNANKAADNGIDSLNFRLKTNMPSDLDIGKSIKVQIPIMVSSFDTSLIKIYELVDSTFEEDMNQKILKNQRLDSAEYRLVFKRPIMGDIVWYPTDSIVRPDWYTATYSANRDTVYIAVTDSAMIKKSKFKNMLKYHNEYYLGEVQKIRDTINTVIIAQKMIKYDRPSRDTIHITYEKAPKRGVHVEPINIDKVAENAIEVVQDREKITLILRDSTAIMKDTLALKVNTFDRYVLNRAQKVVERNLKDTIFAMHKIKYQKIKNKELIGSDSIRFVFERKLASEPAVDLVDLPNKGRQWYTGHTGAKADTFTVVSGDPDFLRLDTIRLAITYGTLTKRETDTLTTDTLMLVRPREQSDERSQGSNRRRKSDLGKDMQQQQQQAKQNMAKASLKIRKDFTITTDTMNHKNLVLDFDGEAGKQYMLEIDDSTFTSIYGTPNLYMSGKTRIRTEDFYGTFTLNLKNVGNVERYADIDDDLPPFQEIDTSHTLRRRINPNDTLDAEYTHIREGQLLVCLCDAKGAIKYMQTVKTDSVMKFEHVVPGDYFIMIIHDRNENTVWDTGKYLEQSYPERTLKYPKKQIVKTKWNTEADWRL